jgi:RNA polymerase sigma factor (sigma-70 family)
MRDGTSSLESTKRESEAELRELIARHLDWVYSLCRRSVRDATLAEDITQTVFMIFVKKAEHLPRGANMSGWLFKTARYCCRNALRDDNTRRRHEMAAGQSWHEPSGEANVPVEEELLGLLDQHVAQLSKADRSVVLLRYYEQCSFKDVGDQLGISEEAARKRVDRAVGKLRARLAGKGISLGADALAATMAEKLVQAAPGKLAAAVMTHAARSTTTMAMPAGAAKLSAKLTLKTISGGKIVIGATGIVLAVGLIGAGIAKTLADHNPSPASASASAKLIISRATTYITSPLDKDGLPDYNLVLKQYLMKGITPENNAAVPAIEIAMQGFRPYAGAKKFDYGPLGLNQLDILKVAAPVTEMPRGHTIASYFRRHPPQGYNLNGRGLWFGASAPVWWRAEIVEQWFAQDFPWRPSRCLMLWEAIRQNTGVIQLIHRASRLPHYYVPDFSLPYTTLTTLIKPGHGQVYPQVPTNDVVGPIGSDIAYSATLELGMRNAHQCWRDIQTVFRLADLTNQSPDEDNSTARNLESKALYACRVLIERLGSHPLLAVHANSWFRRRPLWPIFTERMLHCQRLKALSFLAACYGESKQRTYHYEPVPHNYPRGFVDLFSVIHPPMNLDWNWQFRQLNVTFDHISNEVRTPVSAVEGTALWRWLHSYWRGEKKLSGNRLYQHQFICTLGAGFSGGLENCGVQRCSMLIKAGFALAAYNAVHRIYPKTLTALSPTFLVNPPMDPLNGKPLRYRRTAMGYTLALNGAEPRYTVIYNNTGPTQITVPAPPPTGWQKRLFP